TKSVASSSSSITRS
ncbi:putative seryl-tRNA synthetase, also charges selenocysteinyl-tRNA with serine, partial [Serratia symbiotica str. Tucson]